jgi:hypothetical protein
MAWGSINSQNLPLTPRLELQVRLVLALGTGIGSEFVVLLNIVGISNHRLYRLGRLAHYTRNLLGQLLAR